MKKNYEDKDDKNEEYQELINIKGLEDVIRRKEFLFNVKIDRSQYNKNDEINEVNEINEVIDNEKEEKELEVVENDNRNEN